MAETSPNYHSPERPRLRVGTLLRFEELAYEAPTHHDVRALKELCGKNDKELADIVGLPDAVSFRKWLAPPEANRQTQIPYAAWRLMLLEFRLVAMGSDPCPAIEIETTDGSYAEPGSR